MSHESQRFTNLATMVRLLTSTGASRAKLVEETGLSRDAVEKFVRAFKDEGLIEVVDVVLDTRGRKSVEWFKLKSGRIVETRWQSTFTPPPNSPTTMQRELRAVRSKPSREGSLQDDMRAFFMGGAGPSSESPSSDD